MSRDGVLEDACLRHGGGAKKINVMTMRWSVHYTNHKTTFLNSGQCPFRNQDIIYWQGHFSDRAIFAAAVMRRSQDRRLICECNLSLQCNQHEICSCFLYNKLESLYLPDNQEAYINLTEPACCFVTAWIDFTRPLGDLLSWKQWWTNGKLI